MSVLSVALGVLFAVVLPVAQILPPPSETVQAVVVADLPPDPSAPTAIDAQAVRISQVFGGGGTSAPYICDFIELFNASDQPVSLAGWSVQSATATGPSWTLTPLGASSIPGHSYFQVTEICFGSTPPATDVKGTLSLSTSDGKVALARTAVLISGVNDPAVVDFVGYGGSNQFEGAAAAPRLSSSTAARRAQEGCTDTDDNAADFSAGSVAPRSTKSPTHACPEAAPIVWSTSPKRGAANVARDARLTVDFSESVTLGPEWFQVVCDLSGTRDPASAVVTGGPASYTIDLNDDLYADDACRLTIVAAAVQDADTNDPPDWMTADYTADFRTVPGQCGDPAYPVHSIQGSGASSPATGQLRTIEGVVTADAQGASALSGYFLQDEAAASDADPTTSEAMFVDEHAGSLGDVAAGSRVRVTGVVSEVDGMTALTNATRLLTCPGAEPPQPLDLVLPLAALDEWEQYEAMLVRFSDQLTVADSAKLASDGRLTLVRGGVPLHYTQQNQPAAAGYAAWEAGLALRTVILDDGSQLTYADPVRYPPPALSAANTVRVGDAVTAGLAGVVDGRGASPFIHPTDSVVFVPNNPRTAAPAQTTGNVRVAFLSLNDYFNVTTGAGGPRGASSADEFVRQREKLVAALVNLDADVITVSKLENDGFAGNGALADLTNGLNAATAPGTYAYVDPGLSTWGSDVVTVGSLYRPSSLVPIGLPALLDAGAFDQTSGPPVHRAPMAQTFEERTWGERFTVVVNEWHDRASCPANGDDADAGDGQGCWNAARTAAAEDLHAWLALDPTHGDDPDVLVLGELNALSQEEPIRELIEEGYVDIVDRYVGSGAITSLVGARAGYLDHALASPAMASQVVGAATWSSNAEEPSGLDYQLEHKSPSQQSSLYAPDAYRSSDHNPLVIDLKLLPDQSDLGGNYGSAWHTGQGEWRLGEAWGGEDDGAVRGSGDWNAGQGELVVSVHGPAEHFACLYGWLDFSDGAVEPGVLDSPDGDWDANENVLAGAPLLPGADQVVTFPLPADVLGTDALTMRLRLVPAPEPFTPSCAAPGLAPAAGVGPTGRADGGEVEDYVFELTPLAVDIASFTSWTEGRGIILTWETISEQDLVGFSLERGLSAEGPWEQVTATIPAANPGGGAGASYRYEDEASAAGIVWHRLIGIGPSDSTRELGRVETRILAPNAVRVTRLSGRPAEAGATFTAFAAVGLAGLIILALRRRRRARVIR